MKRLVKFMNEVILPILVILLVFGGLWLIGWIINDVASQIVYNGMCADVGYTGYRLGSSDMLYCTRLESGTEVMRQFIEIY